MHLFKYELSANSLNVKLGVFIIRSIPYTDIEDVKIGYTLWNEHWTNPWPFKFLNIRRKTGLICNFVINPDDRERFVERLKEQIPK